MKLKFNWNFVAVLLLALGALLTYLKVDGGLDISWCVVGIPYLIVVYPLFAILLLLGVCFACIILGLILNACVIVYNLLTRNNVRF